MNLERFLIQVKQNLPDMKDIETVSRLLKKYSVVTSLTHFFGKMHDFSALF